MLLNHGQKNIFITKGRPTCGYGNVVMGIMAGANSLFAISRQGFVSMGLDFLETRGLARSSSQRKDGNKTRYE